MNDSDTFQQPPQTEGNTQPMSPTKEESVKLWRKRLKDAKIFFEPDMKRMRENMEFAAGIQWNGQADIDDKEGRYIANFVTQQVNQKVSSLYAKDPKCKAKMRRRLNYKRWDGTVESEWQIGRAHV